MFNLPRQDEIGKAASAHAAKRYPHPAAYKERAIARAAFLMGWKACSKAIERSVDKTLAEHRLAS